jgi:lipoprotein-anchoring transpeptidase ErfK/SrfK
MTTRKRARVVGGLVTVVAAFALVACTAGGSGSPKASDPQTTGASSTAVTPSTTAASTAAVPTKKVHVSSVEADGQTFGVGMPIILRFTPAPTDSTAFTKAARVTVNGQPVNGAWFWEQPTADEKKAGTIEAHYRPRTYWPANASINVALPIGGLSAGKGLVYDNKLTSIAMSTGDAHISTVDASDLTMTVESNGKVVKSFPVSLGAAKTPTFNGTKIVMQKGEDVPGTDKLRTNGTVMMNGPGYSNDPVQWSVRITRSGEYVHAAPWNNGIGLRSTSNGCTNLHTTDGKWFYDFSQIGDVVTYANTDGTKMPSWDGYGDWNIPWLQWTQGGLLLNH